MRTSMPELSKVVPQAPSGKISVHVVSLLQKIPVIVLISLFYFCASQVAFADSVTYQQVQQRQDGRPRVVAETPAVAPAQTQDQNKQKQSEQSQSGLAQESPDHPEFVRLPDGRIVRYGPGIVCDENCVEPVTPAAFREPGPRMWWLGPAVSGVALCAFLCRGNDEPKPTPTIIIPPIIAPPLPSVSPSMAPSLQPTPDVPQVPEPGTMALFGMGIGVMIIRRFSAKKRKSDQFSPL